MRDGGNRRGFMIVDAIAGMMLLVALAAALATAATLQQKNADHLADQRAAIRIAQQVLASGQSSTSVPEARIQIVHTGKRVGDREWIQATVTFKGRRAMLAGLAPKGGAER